MKIEHYVVGIVGTNCYFAIHPDTEECLVIDPGDQGEQLAEKLRAEGLTPRAILLTHGHFDHIMGVEALRREFSIPVYVHEADQDLLEDPKLNSGAMIGQSVSVTADHTVRDGETLELAGFKVKVLHTPGHTPGGVCYYFPEEEVVFSGDTLFCDSVGRTDLPGGSTSDLVRSIREKVFSLPDLTLVYPGHGEPTKIGYEKQNNPFV
jgi:glyoxylase-like metal-dependent hydrolase (beta-lactamase superfamily II)